MKRAFNVHKSFIKVKGSFKIISKYPNGNLPFLKTFVISRLSKISEGATENLTLWCDSVNRKVYIHCPSKAQAWWQQRPLRLERRCMYDVASNRGCYHNSVANITYLIAKTVISSLWHYVFWPQDLHFLRDKIDFT